MRLRVEKVLRLLIVILLLVLLFALLKRLFSGRLFPGKGPGAGESRIAKMVQCDYCQLYIPQGNALQHAGRYYCCAEHKNKTADKK